MTGDDLHVHGLGEAVGAHVPKAGKAEGILIVYLAVTVIHVQLGGQRHEGVHSPAAVSYLLVGNLTAGLGQHILVDVDGPSLILADITGGDVGVVGDLQRLHDVAVPIGLIQIHVLQIVEVQTAVLGDEGGHVAVGGEDAGLIHVVSGQNGGIDLIENDLSAGHVLDVLVLDLDAQVLLHQRVHFIQDVVDDLLAAGALSVGLGVAVHPGAGVVDADDQELCALVVLLVYGREGKPGLLLGDGGGGLVGYCGVGNTLGGLRTGHTADQHESGQNEGQDAGQNAGFHRNAPFD